MLQKALFLLCLAFGVMAENVEILALDVIPYESLNEPAALDQLKNALYEKGIVGIRGVPGYREKVMQFIEAAKSFSALPEEVKELYAPNRENGDMFLGYEKGKERFKRPDGKWVVDDLKVSYYGFVPDSPHNKWPRELDLQTPFLAIGNLMSEMGVTVMKTIGLLGDKTGVSVDGVNRVGRMLYYRKNVESAAENPFWCGAHFDHGVFTVLLPAFYFADGKQIAEPLEAGLFVKVDGRFQKVVADDPDVMMFQVAEFGQLATDDAIRATEHRVHKADSCVERYTMALFYDAPMDTTLHSKSVLTKDSRYGDGPSCTYGRWHEESFKRYLVQ